MNRDNLLAALDDDGVQALAAQCHSVMMDFSRAITAQDLIVAAVARAEAEGDGTLADVEAHLTKRLGESMLSCHELREAHTAVAQFMEAGDEGPWEVRSSILDFQ